MFRPTDLKIFDPNSSRGTVNRDRRNLLLGGLAALAGGTAALNFGTDSPDQTTQNQPRKTSPTKTQIEDLHKVEPSLPDFETVKEITIASSNFANQLTASNFLRGAPHNDHKTTSETLSSFREKANFAAYLLTLEKTHLTPKLKMMINKEVSTDALEKLTADNYQIQPIKDLFASEQDLSNLMDLVNQRIQSNPVSVSKEAVKTYAELMVTILKSEQNNNKQDQEDSEALSKVFSLIAQYLEKHGNNTSDEDIKYFGSLLSLEEVQSPFGKQYNSRKIQNHLIQLTQMVNSTSTQRIAGEEAHTRF